METPLLIIGGTGRTGRRVAEQLTSVGHRVRIASRRASPAFDWNDPDTWAPVVEGAERAYLCFHPDISMPGADEILGDFTQVAVEHGLRRVVLLSGRGEVAARRAEEVVTETAPEWTVLRSSWFMQDFSEHFLLDAVKARTIVLPAGSTAEPFIDIDDLASVAVQALTQDTLLGRTLELTGPRLITFAQVAEELTFALEEQVDYVSCTVNEFVAGALEQGVPEAEARVLAQVFAQVLDGRNAHVSDDLENTLGRPARDFTGFVRHVTASGQWERS